MAIDNRLQVFNEEGQSVDYDILASDVKFLPDGKDLPTKLAEMEQEIEEAGSGDGTVTGVKVGSTTHEPTEGVVDLSEPFNDKVDKETGKVLIPSTDLAKLQNLPTADQLTQQMNTKANDNAVVKSISVNGTAQSKDTNGNVNIEVQGGGLTKEDISVETQGDGTVDINVADDTYKINLNHTHEGMAKLVVDTAANLPDASEMESDTIYGELSDGEIATIYLGGYPFYGGGASSGPVIRRPAPGSTIDMGQTASGTVSKTINVKGTSLTQALTIQLTGTGYSFGTTQPTGVTRDSSTQLTVTAAAANTLNGVDIVVVYTGNDTDENAEGTIGISSGEGISTSATLIANKVVYELVGVKLTGTQWMQTDYYPNANTEFEMRCRFIENSHSHDKDGASRSGAILGCVGNSGDSKKFLCWQLAPENAAPYNSFGAAFFNDASLSYNNKNQVVTFDNSSGKEYTKFLVDEIKMFYRRGSSNGTFGFNSGGTEYTVATSLKSSTMENPMAIGLYNDNQPNGIYQRFDLVIYELKIKENGTVVRDWVPEERNGVVGLLDVAANGTGTFLSSEPAKTSGLATDELVAVYQPQNNN